MDAFNSSSGFSIGDLIGLNATFISAATLKCVMGNHEANVPAPADANACIVSGVFPGYTLGSNNSEVGFAWCVLIPRGCSVSDLPVAGSPVKALLTITFGQLSVETDGYYSYAHVAVSFFRLK